MKMLMKKCHRAKNRESHHRRQWESGAAAAELQDLQLSVVM